MDTLNKCNRGAAAASEVYTDVYASNLDLTASTNATPVNVARRVDNATRIELIEANVDISGEKVVRDGNNSITLTRITPAYQRGASFNLLETSVRYAGTNFTFTILPGEVSESKFTHLTRAAIQSKLDNYTTQALGRLEIVPVLESVRLGAVFTKLDEVVLKHPNPCVQFTLNIYHPSQGTLKLESFQGKTDSFSNTWFSHPSAAIVVVVTQIHMALDTEIEYPNQVFDSADLRSDSFRRNFCDALNQSVKDWQFGGALVWSTNPIATGLTSRFGVSCVPDQTKEGGFPVDFTVSANLLAVDDTSKNGLPLCIWRMIAEIQYLSPAPGGDPNTTALHQAYGVADDPDFDTTRLYAQESANREIWQVLVQNEDPVAPITPKYTWAEHGDLLMMAASSNWKRVGRIRYTPMRNSSRISPFKYSVHGEYDYIRKPPRINLNMLSQNMYNGSPEDLPDWVLQQWLTWVELHRMGDILPITIAPKRFFVTSDNRLALRMQITPRNRTFRVKIDPLQIDADFARISGLTSLVRQKRTVQYIDFDQNGQATFPDRIDVKFYIDNYFNTGNSAPIWGQVEYEYLETTTLNIEHTYVNVSTIENFVDGLSLSLKNNVDDELEVAISKSKNRLLWSTSGNDMYQIHFNRTTIPNKLLGLPDTNGPSMVEISKDAPYFSPLVPIMPRLNYVFVKVSPYDTCLVTTQGASKQDGKTPDFDAHFAIPVVGSSGSGNDNGRVACIDASTAVPGRFCVPFGRSCSVNRLNITLMDRDNNPLNDTKFEFVLRCYQKL